jgi:transcription elongation GreA/GreB family factor
MIDTHFRKRVFDHCLLLLNQKVDELQFQMKELVASAANDSKSTAGDKHETARAMMQQEQEHLGKQLKEVETQRNHLTMVFKEDSSEFVGEGSLVKTPDNLFFIAIPMGKVVIEETPVFVMSAHSPLCKVLLGKKKGESVIFNQKNLTILDLL